MCVDCTVEDSELNLCLNSSSSLGARSRKIKYVVNYINQEIWLVNLYKGLPGNQQ